MVRALPELAWEDIEVKKIKAYKSDSADYQVKVNFRNKGKLPTALKQAHLVKIVREDRIVLDFDTAGFAKGDLFYKILPESGQSGQRENRGSLTGREQEPLITTATKNVFFTQGGETTKTVFKIRVYNNREVAVKASLFSTRGGVLRGKEFIIR